jgi:hypothetical protein
VNIFSEALFGNSGKLRANAMQEQMNRAYMNTTIKAYISSLASENANLRFRLSMVEQELRLTRLTLEAIQAKEVTE